MKTACEYEKRILLAVSGMSPQIVTETLFSLACQKNEPFIPTAVFLITTLDGKKQAEQQLLHPETGKFHQFCKDYALPAIEFSADNILVIADRDGVPLNDIKTPENNEDAADFITRMVRNLTRDDNAALHVSIAGGRKTMGYYLGYALSLYGRPQDRLSHVLVTDLYEGLPEFFYPTPYSQIIFDKRKERSLDTQEAEVMLAEIPFVRLRRGIPQALLDGEAGFSQSVQFAQRFEAEPRLLLDTARQKLWANEVEVKLKGINFAFYRWMIAETVQKSGVVYRQVEPSLVYAADFLALYRSLSSDMKDIDKTEKALQKGMEAQWLSERMSAVRKAFEKAIGETAARGFVVLSEGRNNALRYRVPLLEKQVVFV